VKIKSGSLLSDILPEPGDTGRKSDDGEVFFSVDVNSFHLQAVKDIAPGFAAAAFAPDGIVEAIEPAPDNGAAHRFTFGVQWHPERMWRHHAHAARLFKKFAEAGRARGD
jgi:gamma-glutamyl-gamma-aminobutyrate hydrolase PuuD